MKARTEEEEKQEQMRTAEGMFLRGVFTLRHVPPFEGFRTQVERDFTVERVVEGTNGDIWLQGHTPKRNLTLKEFGYSGGTVLYVQGFTTEGF